MGRWEEKLDRARRLHRPSLKDWECDGLYETFEPFVASLQHEQNASSQPQDLPILLDAETLSREVFWKEYEAKKIPCVIRNIPQINGWAATQKWQLEALENNDEIRNRLFKCGEDDDGRSIKVKLKHFLKYMRHNRDDSPLYIFASHFDEDKRAKTLLDDYQVPSYFSEDLFNLISESRRPPYRWFLVGPQRSGTTVHVDPLATSAWNTLIVGQKRWVLFPPHIPKHVVKGKRLIRDDEDDEAVHYFMYILPRIKRQAAAVGSRGDYQDFQCYEFTQNEGETVFVPNGWWHAVLNLTHTVGVTQNYVSPRNFNEAWIKTRTGRKRMAWKWLSQLDEHYPVLAHRARAMNEKDGFVMKYDPVEIERREKEERLEREQKAARRREEEEHRRMDEKAAELCKISNGSSHGAHCQEESESKRSRVEHYQRTLSCG